MKLLAEWLKRLPPASRDSSLRDLLQDPAMATLRRRLRSLEAAGPVPTGRVCKPASSLNRKLDAEVCEENDSR